MIPSDHPLAKRIKTLLPINGLEAWLQDEVLVHGEFIEFEHTATVFREGDDDPYALFLIDGCLSLRAGDQTPSKLHSGDEDALRAVAQLRPRRYTAICAGSATLFRIRRAVLEHILSDEQVSKEGAILTSDDDETNPDTQDWMSRMLASELFTRLPPDQMQRFFVELEPVAYAAGDTVVEQGSPGDYLYIVAEGQFQVLRRARGSSNEQLLAQLDVGDVFGEEALISETPRNATVRALTNAMMMRLPKASFEELVSKPVLRPVAYPEAEQLVADGAIWVDVRFQEEFATYSLDGAINVPLNLLRLQLAKLNTNASYITYCDTGGRASTAAFLMMRGRIDARYLAGGLMHSPFAARHAGLDAPSALPTAAHDKTTAVKAAPQTSTQKATVADIQPAAARAQSSADLADAKHIVAPATEPAAEPVTAPTEPSNSGEQQRIQTAHAAEINVLNEQLRDHATRLQQERARHERARGVVQQELQTLRADRDAQTAKLAKTVHAARELKSQAEQARRSLASAQAQRQRLEHAQQAALAEQQRTREMEVTRLQIEIESVHSKALQQQVQLSDEFHASEARHAATVDDLHSRAIETQDNHASVVTEHESQLSLRRDELESASAKALVLEAEASTARVRIEVLEARFEVTRQTIMTQESELQDVNRKETQRLAQQANDVDAEQASIAADRHTLIQLKANADAIIERERSALNEEQSHIQQQAQELTEERIVLHAEHTAAQTIWRTEQEHSDARLAEQQQDLLAAEATLREEERHWLARVADAVADERAKLTGELRDVEQAMQEFTRERDATRADLGATAQALEAEQQQLAHARRKFEHETTQMKANQAAAAAELEAREEALEALRTARLAERTAHEQRAQEQSDSRALQHAHETASVKATYERRLAEQAAILADEKRQLESQTVRLKDALASQQAERTATPAPPIVRKASPEWNEQSDRQRVMSPKQLAELRKRITAKITAAKT